MGWFVQVVVAVLFTVLSFVISVCVIIGLCKLPLRLLTISAFVRMLSCQFLVC